MSYTSTLVEASDSCFIGFRSQNGFLADDDYLIATSFSDSEIFAGDLTRCRDVHLKMICKDAEISERKAGLSPVV